ncbi:hypothetical protein COLO4_27540 [Corchorus olitorius]|uniref:Protein kinase domain-containing protein n=1 Tax=Corchorus olitorius TaxID=93759 RepID=A0A1R3HQK8_9ROSI|nr:hypothetical protein COLO4_27540 [Corchorus olitorius]
MEKFSAITPITIFFTLLPLAFVAIADQQRPYVPIENITLNCGASSDLNDPDGRFWAGDNKGSKFGPNIESSSISYKADTRGSVVDTVPYMTARVSSSEFTYRFNVSQGKKFVRLYFYPVSYGKFDQAKAYFSVKTENQVLDLIFTPTDPSASNDTYHAFINGIEIVSMPPQLYNLSSPTVETGLRFIGQRSTALETVYRLNVGGRTIPPVKDSGMLFRLWSDDFSYLLTDNSYFSANFSLPIKYTKIPSYTAPEEVYMTARSMGPNHTYNKLHNLTWGLPVDSGFTYMDIEQQNEQSTITISLHPLVDKYFDSILNGIEVFKLSDAGGNLAAPNPQVSTISPHDPSNSDMRPPIRKSGNKRTRIVAIVGPISSFIAISLLVFFIYRILSNKVGTRNTPQLPSDVCRHFSLREIKVATNNFDPNFIVGRGGFGDVYKGFINDGSTIVAIKRLNPSSKQGVHEFKTEIEMLSQLRHQNLVSLIGYCEDGKEMLLVYDYMAHGTLRDHLYNTNNPPLLWNQRLKICIGAAYGLNYLHRGPNHTIIHRDVKTANILLSEKWVAKVSDFGLSKMNDMSNTHISTVVKGSFGYLDPEYYRLQQLSEKSDVYSFGVVLSEVLCARAPIDRTRDHMEISLVEWVKHCYKNEILNRIVDSHLQGR